MKIFYVIALLSIFPSIYSKIDIYQNIEIIELSTMDGFNWIGLEVPSFLAWVIQIVFYTITSFILMAYKGYQPNRYFALYYFPIVIWPLFSLFSYIPLRHLFVSDNAKFVHEVIWQPWVFRLGVEIMLVLIISYFERAHILKLDTRKFKSFSLVRKPKSLSSSGQQAL